MTRYLAITIWQLWACFCGAPSLTRGWVCLLYMLLGLPNVVFLESESLGTRDRILLSQIWDFPYCRLLRLAGSRWRYSTPLPHGSLVAARMCLPSRCLAMNFYSDFTLPAFGHRVTILYPVLLRSASESDDVSRYKLIDCTWNSNLAIPSSSSSHCNNMNIHWRPPL
jgi:hypothetical protein